MAKSANLYARIEPEVKEQAEAILSALGIPASNAITMFYKQVILQWGLPFEVKLPEHPLDLLVIQHTISLFSFDISPAAIFAAGK